MGATCCGIKSDKKTRQQYYREIFDGLDTDGTQNLDANELRTVWEKVKARRLENLQKRLDIYVARKQKEIQDVRNADANTMVKDGKVTLSQFIEIIKFLNMSDEELHTFWVQTKEHELVAINSQLVKHR